MRPPSSIHAAAWALLGTALASLAATAVRADGAADQPGQAAVEPHLPGEPPPLPPLRRGPDGRIEVIGPGNAAPGPLCDADALCVGAGQAYPTLGAALAAASPGAVVEIVGGVYRETDRITQAHLTLRGVAGRPHFDCARLTPVDDKACLLLAADGITLDNIEISGAANPPGDPPDAACIRSENESGFALRDVFCYASQEGVVAEGGRILIENSEFYDNGWTADDANGDFLGACTATIRGSVFRDARRGDELRSRCPRIDISDSTIRSTTGARNLDIADGGEAIVYRTTLVKATAATDPQIVAFAPESCPHPGDMLLKDVTIDNSRNGAEIRNYGLCGFHAIVVENPTLSGFPITWTGFIQQPGQPAPKTVPPNQPGSIPPGSVPPGSIPPGSIPPGSMPPGSNQPAPQ